MAARGSILGRKPEEAIAALLTQRNVEEAARTMIDPDTPASVRVRAAECVMNHATKAIEIEDVEARVTALEEAAGAQGKR